MSLSTAGSVQDGTADRPMRLVPFRFWLPFSDANRSLRGSIESWADGGSASGEPADATTEMPLADRERTLPGQAAEAPGTRSGLPPTLATLQQTIRERLAGLGHAGAEPLRWAITGVDPRRGLRLEGIGLSHAAPTAEAPGEQTAITDPSSMTRCSVPLGDSMLKDAAPDAAALQS